MPASWYYRKGDHAARDKACVGMRLCGLSPSWCASLLEISVKAAKEILARYGHVARKGNRYDWRGPYSISESAAKRLALPDYIPRSAGPIAQVFNDELYMLITADLPSGYRRAKGWEPFYPHWDSDD
jgi:hypothetical protein